MIDDDCDDDDYHDLDRHGNPVRNKLPSEVLHSWTPRIPDNTGCCSLLSYSCAEKMKIFCRAERTL